MDGLDDALRLIPTPFLYGLHKKNSLNFFNVTSLYFLGQSVIEKAGITKSVRKIKIKTPHTV